ncbi:helix-turn-helix transcriptional regulator [Ascidiimonas aurantiaca]|uniref:helix-turn-helix domain-containing protein n=1 Tax=Ascidiimonas aurantiaca TaxID=1685432 RepID=UPI0030ED1FAE
MESEEFRRIRKNAGLNQEALAALIKKSKRTVQSYEAGTFNIPANVVRKMRELEAETESLYVKKKKVSNSIYMDVSKLKRISLRDAVDFCIAYKEVFLEEPEIKSLLEKERNAGKIEIMEKHIVLKSQNDNKTT